MIWATDKRGDLIYISPAWYAFSGLTSETTLGTAWLDAVHPDDRDFVIAGFRQATDRGLAYTHEYRVRHHTGRYVWVHEAAAPSWVPGTRDFVGFLGLVGPCPDQGRANPVPADIGLYRPVRPGAAAPGFTDLERVAEHLIAAKAAALSADDRITAAIDDALFRVGRAIALEMSGEASSPLMH